MTDRLNLPMYISITLVFFFSFTLTLFSLLYVSHNRRSVSVLASDKHSGDTINLLEQNWQYMPGVSQDNDQFKIAPIDLSIVEQDGSESQTNPPLNLYGAHLENTGDFKVSVSFNQINGDCSLQLYTKPPIISDEFRIEPASIKLTVENKSITFQIWNGKNADKQIKLKPNYTKTVPISKVNDLPLTISRLNNSIILSADRKQFVSLPTNIFNFGSIWFGLSSRNGGCSLSSLQAAGLNSGSLKVIDTTKTTINRNGTSLNVAALKTRPSFKVGAAIALGPFVSDQQYASAVVSNFGSITAENAMKWQSLEPKPGKFNFQEADALVAIAQKNNISVHGHTLVFSEANPTWVNKLPTRTLANKQTIKDAMLNHIKMVVSRYKGKISSWDVVNEPLADYDDFNMDSGNVLRSNKWKSAMGNDYIPQAFHAAHKADPKAKLFINEYGLEEDGERWDSMLALVTKLKKSGVPIEGVGFQSHVYDKQDKVNPAVLNKHFKQLAKIGLVARISEADVYDDDGVKLQAQQYTAIYRTCLQNSNCVSFTTWGVDDRYDVFEDDDGNLEYGHDFLYNHGKQTPAYKSLLGI